MLNTQQLNSCLLYFMKLKNVLSISEYTCNNSKKRKD